MKDRRLLPRPKNSARVQALRCLARKNYSRAKLMRKLTDLKYPLEEAEDAVQHCADKGYLNEDDYVYFRVQKWMNQGHSMAHIQKILEQEGLQVPMETILSIFEEKGESEKKQIHRLIQKKLRQKQNPALPEQAMGAREVYKLKGKILSYLFQKGHEATPCLEALQQYLPSP